LPVSRFSRSAGLSCRASSCRRAGARRQACRAAREAAGRWQGGAARPVRPLSDPRFTTAAGLGTSGPMTSATYTVPPLIETERLRLRPHRLSDKDVHIAMWADERVTRFIGGEPRAPDVSWGKFL